MLEKEEVKEGNTKEGNTKENQLFYWYDSLFNWLWRQRLSIE